MSDKKRYTAQEMREVLNTSWHDLGREMVHDMLRQAADAEEELDALRKATKVEVHLDGAEVNAALVRKVDEMGERAEELKSQLLKICGRDTCDHKGSKCICCARDVLDFVIHGDAAEGGVK